MQKQPAGGLAAIGEKDVSYDCNQVIQKNGFATQVSQVSVKLMEGECEGSKLERGGERESVHFLEKIWKISQS